VRLVIIAHDHSVCINLFQMCFIYFKLFKLKDVVYILSRKDGQGRYIKLTGRNHRNNLRQLFFSYKDRKKIIKSIFCNIKMHDLLQTPSCSLHSQKQEISLTKTDPSTGWLPNVIVSLRAFKSTVSL